MVEPHTPTRFNDILNTAYSVDDEVAKREKLFGEKQPLHKLNVYPSLSLACILRLKLLYRMYSMGYMSKRRKWLHWLVQ